MADHLSTSANVAGIVSFAGGLSKIFVQFLQTINDAPEDAVSVCLSLSALTGALTQIQFVALDPRFAAADDGGHATRDINECLVACQSVFLELRNKLKDPNLVPNIPQKPGAPPPPAVPAKRAWGSVRWSFNDNYMATLLRQLENIKGTLVAIIKAFGIKVIGATQPPPSIRSFPTDTTRRNSREITSPLMGSEKVKIKDIHVCVSYVEDRDGDWPLSEPPRVKSSTFAASSTFDPRELGNLMKRPETTIRFTVEELSDEGTLGSWMVGNPRDSPSPSTTKVVLAACTPGHPQLDQSGLPAPTDRPMENRLTDSARPDTGEGIVLESMNAPAPSAPPTIAPASPRSTYSKPAQAVSKHESLRGIDLPVREMELAAVGEGELALRNPNADRVHAAALATVEKAIKSSSQGQVEEVGLLSAQPESFQGFVQRLDAEIAKVHNKSSQALALASGDMYVQYINRNQLKEIEATHAKWQAEQDRKHQAMEQEIQALRSILKPSEIPPSVPNTAQEGRGRSATVGTAPKQKRPKSASSRIFRRSRHRDSMPSELITPTGTAAPPLPVPQSQIQSQVPPEVLPQSQAPPQQQPMNIQQPFAAQKFAAQNGARHNSAGYNQTPVQQNGGARHNSAGYYHNNNNNAPAHQNGVRHTSAPFVAPFHPQPMHADAASAAHHGPATGTQHSHHTLEQHHAEHHNHQHGSGPANGAQNGNGRCYFCNLEDKDKGGQSEPLMVV